MILLDDIDTHLQATIELVNRLRGDECEDRRCLGAFTSSTSGGVMRGSLHKASMKRGSLPKGQFRWNIMLSLGRAEDGKYKQKCIRFCGTRRQAEQKLVELTGEIRPGRIHRAIKDHGR